MKNLIAGILFASLCIFISCSDTNSKKMAEDESCVNPTLDPHDVKPMALMMRTMANYCDSMRLEINAGKTVDSLRYPLMPFWTVEPTDSTVLEPLFYNHAKDFEAAYRKLMMDIKNQPENYTAVINRCVQCHSSYCSGPLKRIRKLTLDYKPE